MEANTNGMIPGSVLGGAPTGGAACDSFVINVVVHVPGVVLVPAVGVQLTAAPSGVVPFMNCTVPVTPGVLFPVPVTVAVKVTLPPEATLVALGITVVVVTTVPPELTLNAEVPVEPV
jgi:hypothetical protein